MSDRLTAGFWVSAYLARLRFVDIPAFVVKHGDDTAGAVIVVSNTLDGRSKAFHRVYNADFERQWDVLAEGDSHAVDTAVSRQRDFDPDLWIIEVEDRHGRTLLDEDGLA